MSSSRSWSFLILLSIFEGVAALAALFIIPGDRFSLARLALMGVNALIVLALGWLSLRSRDADWHTRWLDSSARPTFHRGMTIAAALLFLTSGLLLYLLRYLHPEATASYFLRLRPLLTYFMLLGAQTSLWLTWQRSGFHPAALRTRRGLFLSAAIFLAVFLALWLVIRFTGLGITEDPSYWGEPGVPILGWQLLTAILLSIFFTFYVLRFNLPSRADILLALGIWLLAVILWMSVPLATLRNSFYAPIQPPFTQPLPNSDAIVYDSNAQSLLLGNDFVAKIPPRPLYILFLAVLHAFFGQDYGRIVFAQTLLLALFPVALYFLGRQLHSRTAGLTVALLAIFRELTSLWVSSAVRVANTKMLLSDFISMLALAAYLLLVLRWYRDKRGSLFYAFLAGGLLGLQVLLRSQSLFIAPGVLALALFVFWPDWKNWVLRSFVFSAGLALAIAPWVARNYFVTGQASLDDPNQVRMVASVYSGGTPTSNHEMFDNMPLPEVSKFVTDTILHRPGYVAGFVANQFLANTIDSLLVLPIFARYDDLTQPIFPYWYEWLSYLSPLNIVLLLVYLAGIALGLAAAWKRLGWAGLLPLVYFIFYTFSTSLARFSGWRYIFPADWVPYFYFGLGLVECLTALFALFGADAARLTPDLGPASPSQPTRPARVLLAGGLILLVGALPWIAEATLPSRLTVACREPVAACLSARGVDASQAQAFLAQPNTVGLAGRVFYPRYFSRNDGLPSTNPLPAYAPRDFPRTGFLFMTTADVQSALLPMKGARAFPNGEEAVLLGCRREKYIEVRMIVFPSTGETFANGSLAEPCQ